MSLSFSETPNSVVHNPLFRCIYLTDSEFSLYLLEDFIGWGEWQTIKMSGSLKGATNARAEHETTDWTESQGAEREEFSEQLGCCIRAARTLYTVATDIRIKGNSL